MACDCGQTISAVYETVTVDVTVVAQKLGRSVLEVNVVIVKGALIQSVMFS